MGGAVECTFAGPIADGATPSRSRSTSTPIQVGDRGRDRHFGDDHQPQRTPTPCRPTTPSPAFTFLDPQADLEVTTVGDDSVAPGDTGSTAIVVTSLGPSDAAGHTVSLPLPAGTTFEPTWFLARRCTLNGSTVDCVW
ncbi:MAG: hypothetical protein R2710_04300 [Acidimicrobiales bacterium]